MLGRIEGIQLTILVELANKSIFNEVPCPEEPSISITNGRSQIYTPPRCNPTLDKAYLRRATKVPTSPITVNAAPAIKVA